MATRQSISFDLPTRAYLTLPASKADTFRRGITLTIAASGDSACPVSALIRLFQQYPALPTSPLFCRAGSLLFTREYMVSSLHEILTLEFPDTIQGISSIGEQPPQPTLQAFPRTTYNYSGDGDPMHTADM
ncbi:hypothetical protein RUND412_006988 [Rhizina undulata]